jgi:hypothetical protein
MARVSQFANLGAGRAEALPEHRDRGDRLLARAVFAGVAAASLAAQRGCARTALSHLRRTETRSLDEDAPPAHLHVCAWLLGREGRESALAQVSGPFKPNQQRLAARGEGARPAHVNETCRSLPRQRAELRFLGSLAGSSLGAAAI